LARAGNEGKRETCAMHHAKPHREGKKRVFLGDRREKRKGTSHRPVSVNRRKRGENLYRSVGRSHLSQHKKGKQTRPNIGGLESRSIMKGDRLYPGGGRKGGSRRDSIARNTEEGKKGAPAFAWRMQGREKRVLALLIGQREKKAYNRPVAA